MDLSDSLKSLVLSRELSVLPGKSDREHRDGWLPAWMHLTDTAMIFLELLRRWVPESVKRVLMQDHPEDLYERTACFLALTHDLGKLTPVFQSSLLPFLPDIREKLLKFGISVPLPDAFADKASSPHALAGAVILMEHHCESSVYHIIGAHHGKPINEETQADMEDQTTVYGKNYYGGAKKNTAEWQFWFSVREEWLRDALSLCGFSDCASLPEIPEQAQILYTGLLIISDWIASNPQYCPLLPIEEEGSTAMYPGRTDHALDALSLPEPWMPCSFTISDSLFASRFGFFPNTVQHDVLEVLETCGSPGILILEAPMGCGKTEAALAAAEVLASRSGEGGVFFGLPTQATSNGIFPRLQAWAEARIERNARMKPAQTEEQKHSKKPSNCIYFSLAQSVEHLTVSSLAAF